MGIVFEFFHHRIETRGGADRRTRHHTVTVAVHIAHHRFPGGSEPAFDSGIQDLVGGGVEAILLHQMACPVQFLGLGGRA
jgi:hypothetical protein